MEESYTDRLSVDSATEDNFGPPHAQAVSESLHFWILFPGLIGIIFVGACVV